MNQGFDCVMLTRPATNVILGAHDKTMAPQKSLPFDYLPVACPIGRLEVRMPYARHL